MSTTSDSSSERIVAVDTFYGSLATTAAIVFENWSSSTPTDSIVDTIPIPHEYIPGEFYRRELPCILSALQKLSLQPTAIIVDSFVNLAERKGLGQHLYEQLKVKCPVIGVAKNPMADEFGLKVYRGTSQSPLYVTAVGIDVQEAAAKIQTMHGNYRMPTLLKLVDQMSRKPLPS